MLPLVLGGASSPLRLLCIGAHSDDIEIGCGGTVMRLLAERKGSSVHWVVLSADPARELEARASAADFLASSAETTLIVKSFRESYFPYIGAEIKDFFEELKRAVTPDIVFCHHRNDLHQDHRLTAELAWNTFRSHLIAEYEIPKYEGDLVTPNLYVPLPRNLAERKVELLLRHFHSQSSRSWFRSETFEGIMAVRGVECAASDACAEAFVVRKMIL